MNHAIYSHNIPSIRDKNPGLPAVIPDVDLDHRIAIGDPVDRHDLRHAKAAAETLRGVRKSGQVPVVTEDLVASAELRALMVESAQATIEYNPQNIQIQPALHQINIQLANLTRIVMSGQARADNVRILNRNSRIQSPPQVLQPLQKSVEGYGRNLAIQVANGLGMQAQHNLNIMAPAGGVAANVGSTPHNFNPALNNYQHIDVLRMVVFYNEDFGILPQDSLGDRIDKFRRFLIEF